MAAVRAIDLKTTIPGPRSREIMARLEAAVSSALSVYVPIVAAEGHGSTLTDVDGNTFIDFTGGVGCLNIGHAHPHVTAAVQEQAARFLHTDFTMIPYEIYVELAPVRVTLVYRSRQGLPATALPGISALIVEFKGSLDAPILGKAIGPGTTLEAVPLSTGTAAYWLAGQPHQFFYRDSTGNIQPDTLRLAGNTLLWDVGGITHRLEAQVSREEAVRIASSFH